MRQILILSLLIIPSVAFSQDQPESKNPLAYPLEEQRYCGPPERNVYGRIKRDTRVIYRFRKVHPCPVTGFTTGACPGWSVDHVIPLVCGGCDAVSNTQWLPNEIKSAAGDLPKDRWEQRVYCHSELNQ